MSAPLYVLTENILAIEEVLARIESGEISDEEGKAILQESLASTEEAFESKVEKYCQFIRNQEAVAAACKDEVARLSARATTCENAVKRLKQVMKDAFALLGKQKVDAGTFKVTVANNGGKAPMRWLKETLNPDDFPERFVVTTRSVDTAAIRAAVEAGDAEALQFAVIEERGTHVRIS